MISFDEFKHSLGSEAQKLTDDQIENLRQWADRFADLFFDMWLKNLNADNSVDLVLKDDNMSVVCKDLQSTA